MNRYEVDLAVPHERASATPDPGLRTRSAPAQARETLSQKPKGTPDPTLRGRQVWFARALMTPETEPLGVGEDEAGGWLTPGPRLSAIERLEIYRRAYHGRLIECLADDYPVLQHALGEPDFEALCRAYVARHPSGAPSLNYFGRHMAAFCRDGAPLASEMRSFASDLSRLEWAIVEVIHAPTEPPLTLDGLGEVPAEAWAGARLAPNTAVRLLAFEHPVNAYFQAYRDGADPVIPSATPAATVVYRSGPTIWRMDLTVPMFEVLSALLAGETLGASLGRAEKRLAHIAEAEAAARVTTWFREWIASGLFVRVVLG